MKKTIIALFCILLILPSTMGLSEIGLGHNNPKGATVVAVGGLPLLAVYNLKSQYNLGEIISIGTYQAYIGGCQGNVYLTLEVYSVPVGQHTTSNYMGGDSALVQNPISGRKYYGDLNYRIPSNAVDGDWSLSAYLYCTNPSSVVSFQTSTGTKADEKNFEVVDPTLLPTCISKHQRGCFAGDVYWYDSCGNREGRFADCITGELCSNGACRRPACESDYIIKCYSDDLYWYDSCDKREGRYKECDYSCTDAGVCKSQPPNVCAWSECPLRNECEELRQGLFAGTNECTSFQILDCISDADACAPPKIVVRGTEAKVEGNIIKTTIQIANEGGDMQEDWIIEIQPRPKGLEPLAVVGEQQNCNPSFPENVHRVYRLNELETITMNFDTSVKDGEYDVFAISVNKCYDEEPKGNIATEPFGRKFKVDTVTVGKPNGEGFPTVSTLIGCGAGLAVGSIGGIIGAPIGLVVGCAGGFLFGTFVI